MGGISIPAGAFRFAHEDRATLCDKAEASEMDLTWRPTIREGVTRAEVDAVIERIADTGYYDDMHGNAIRAGEMYRAIAIDWVDNPLSLPGYTYTAFLKWATAIAAIAKYGK